MFQLTEDIKKLFDKFPFGFSIWERRGNNLYSVYRNIMADKLMGTKRERMIGREFERCYPNNKDRKKNIFRVLDKGATYRLEESRFISKKRKGLFRFTLMKIDSDIAGIIIEPLRRCIKTNKDGTQCLNMAVLGDFCMSHVLTQLGRSRL